MRYTRDYGGDGDGDGGLIRLHNSIIVNEILLKLDLDTLCSVACVCKTLRFSVSQALSSLSSLDLSTFSPDELTLNHIKSRSGDLKCVTVDCLQLDDFSVSSLIGPHIQELNLFKCSSPSYQVLVSIGQSCPNLRVLVLELAGQDLPELFKRSLVHTLKGCSQLESLCIKIRGTILDSLGFNSVEIFLPKTIRVLKLQPVREQDAARFIHKLNIGKNFSEISTNFITLRCLSLVLDIISDELIIFIANSLPLLLELDLKDRPSTEPLLPRDLTNTGLQSLVSCSHLTQLSLLRSKRYYPASFKRINDIGIFLLSEGCKGLESITLGGFSKVSDAGFATMIHSCRNLKRFEVRNASLLSDLAFHDISRAPCSLVEVRLLSCNLITSETVNELASSNSLEMLDLCGCKSIADSCLSSISCLLKLTILNLQGADVTDNGLAVLGRATSPITHLCLRGCKRVTDMGITLLFHGGGLISKTLSAFDIGYNAGISDKAIESISEVAINITELCLRHCFFVTDASVKKLGSERSKPIRKLDLFHCLGLSVKSFGLLKKPLFRGLQWLGVGDTRLTSKGEFDFAEICEERPWMTICLDGCEIGCRDGWHFH